MCNDELPNVNHDTQVASELAPRRLRREKNVWSENSKKDAETRFEYNSNITWSQEKRYSKRRASRELLHRANDTLKRFELIQTKKTWRVYKEEDMPSKTENLYPPHVDKKHYVSRTLRSTKKGIASVMRIWALVLSRANEFARLPKSAIFGRIITNLDYQVGNCRRWSF